VDRGAGWLAPRKIGEGRSPAVSRGGDRVAFVRKGQLCGRRGWQNRAVAGFSKRGASARTGLVAGWRAHRVRERPWRPQPDWRVRRGAQSLRYLDPGTDSDMQPEWSPDGRSMPSFAFPAADCAPSRGSPLGEPWSMRVAKVETGVGREIWRASAGPGSVFREITARNQLLWADGGRIVFPWEGDG